MSIGYGILIDQLHNVYRDNDGCYFKTRTH